MYYPGSDKHYSAGEYLLAAALFPVAGIAFLTFGIGYKIGQLTGLIKPDPKRREYSDNISDLGQDWPKEPRISLSLPRNP